MIVSDFPKGNHKQSTIFVVDSPHGGITQELQGRKKKTLASPDPRRKIEALLTPLIGSCTSTPWSLAALWEQ